MKPVRLHKPSVACCGYANGNAACFTFYGPSYEDKHDIMFRWSRAKFQEFGHNVAQRWQAETALALEIS